MTLAFERQELIRRLRERLGSRKGHVVVLFCDEAQRQSRNSYEWLRDVHDQLAYHGIRLITFLIGQPQLLAQKAGFQMSGDEQIVARFMIEQLLFHGIRDATEAATCLAGYDKTRYRYGPCHRRSPQAPGLIAHRDNFASAIACRGTVGSVSCCSPAGVPIEQRAKNTSVRRPIDRRSTAV